MSCDMKPKEEEKEYVVSGPILRILVEVTNRYSLAAIYYLFENEE
jgi:hypothetical protein